MKNSNDKKFKRTEIGMIPSDWKVLIIKQFSSICAGGTPSTLVDEYWGGSIPWMNSGEIHLKKIKDVSGRITINGLNNSSTKLLPKYCVLIALAGQGKTRGTVGINMVELCTNQSVAAIMPSAYINSMFLYYYLDSQYRKLRELSDGDGGRGGLTKALLEKVMVPIPSKIEQEKIANAFTRIDNLIEDYEKLIKKKEKIKQGLMQNLLTGKVRLKGYNDKWEKVLLEEVLDYEQPTKYIVRSTNYLNKGIPVLTAGKSLILGYTNEMIDVYDKGEVIIFDDFLTTSKFINYPFKIKSSAIKLLTKKRGMDCLSFIYYKMQDIDFLAYEHKRYWISEYSKIKIELPSGKEQQSISKVLSNAYNEINDLKTKLNKIKDIKKGMLDNLLTGKIRL